MLQFSILKWSAWAPGRAQKAEWVEEVRPNDPAFLDVSTAPNIKEIPMMMRRRLSRFGKIASRVTLDVLDEENSGLPLVFSSRYGEAEITAKMLELICTREPLSPTAFSLSVHNAVPGFLSIQTKSTAAHTAIAAGPSSFIAGLFEAASQVNDIESPDAKVVFTHCDTPLPEIYPQNPKDNVPSFATSIVLGKPTSEGYTLGYKIESLKTNSIPQDAAISFVNYLATNATDWEWANTNRVWSCRKHAA